MQLVNDTLIKEWEGLRLTAYKPTPNDVWTIGWGHTKTAKQGMTITEEEAQRLFNSDVSWAVEAVNKLVKVPLNQAQFDALVSFVFNVGETAFARSTLLKKLNLGDYSGAANEFPRWNKQAGKALKGLTRRRAHEQELFLSDVVDIPEETTAAKPEADEDNTLKHLTASKEMIAGVLTSATGALAAVTPTNQSLIIIALILAGIFLIFNRLWARKKGKR